MTDGASQAVVNLVKEFDAVFAEPMAFAQTARRLFLNIAVQQENFAIPLEALTE